MAALSGVTIFVDGVAVGTTDESGSVSITGLHSGPHTLTTSKQCYDEATTSISVPLDTSKFIKLIKKNFTLTIQSEPFASIYIDGTMVGSTDIVGNFTFTVPCPGGEYVIKSIKMGYYDNSKTVSITSDSIQIVPLTQVTYSVTVSITD